MTDPKSQMEMFEDDRMQAILGNMMIVEGVESQEKETVAEKEEIKKEE